MSLEYRGGAVSAGAVDLGIMFRVVRLKEITRTAGSSLSPGPLLCGDRGEDELAGRVWWEVLDAKARKCF